MLNLDMSSLQKDKDGDYLFQLFNGCNKLKNIKMSGNYKDKNYNMKESEIFDGLPNYGSFTWKKGNDIDNILKVLPINWNRQQE